MFMAAKEDQASPLHLFELALEIISSGNQDYSALLGKYFDTVVSQAQEVVKNPGSSISVVAPEAIALATRLIADSNLAEELAKAPQIRQITPEIASRILMELR